MRKNWRQRGLAILAAGALLAIAIPTAASAAPEEWKERPARPSTPVDDATSDLLEKLTLPPVDEDVAAWSDAVLREFDGDPQFHTVGIDDTRTKVTVWWHGERTERLEDAVSDNLSAEIVVQSTPYSPKELQDAVDRVRSDPRLSVTYTSIRPDGTGIDVAVEGSPTARSDAQNAVELAAAGVPVNVTTGKTEPFSRDYDSYGIGGARIAGWDGTTVTNYCTSGFAVQNANDPTRKGLLTAAHCGAVGQQFGVVNPPNIFLRGPIVERWTDMDAAVIEQYSQPYVYTGPFTSNTVTPINGNRNAPIGAEICYTGSYTGLVCGNIVTSKTASWGTATGLRTDQAAGIISAGQGDSGGPGYWLTVENGTVKRYAAAIIGAGPPGTTQNGGCPGREAARVCGAAVVAGETWRVSTTKGWNIQYVP
ncbi:MAG: hypothetical protein WBX17_06865 [Microbacterium sp.]